MNLEPLISIIVPSYNHEKFIAETIESLLNQTYKNREIIVLDDGSTDNSIKIIEKFKDEKNFVYATQNNQGICKTLNRAIREYSKGEYISIIASDDIWHESKLQFQIDKMIENPFSELCYSQAIEFSSSEGNFGKIFPSYSEGWMLNKVYIRQHVPAGTMLFTRKLYNEIGGFDESLIEEDWDFVIRSAAKTKFSFVNKPLLIYRKHDKNIMKIRSRKLIFLEKKKILYKNRNLVNPLVYLISLFSHFLYDLYIYKIIKRFKI